MKKNDTDERVLVIAPLGQDASAMAELFATHGFETLVCEGPGECGVQINAGAGAMVFTEEALEMAHTGDLLDALKAQPKWSELPIIILTAGGESRLGQLLELAKAAAGAVTLLERPIGTKTLVRSLEVALKSRRRQYHVRDLLEEQCRNERQLREAHEQLADRAKQLESLVESRTLSLAQSIEQLRHEVVERQQAEEVRDALRRKLLDAQEEERRRIARELHDQMGQNLTALNFGLKSLDEAASDSAELRSLVQPLQELAVQTARDLRRIALELRPAVLDDLGLVKAVRNLIEIWSNSCRIEVDLEAKAYSPCGVSSEIEMTLYRVIQEALNNIAKHSGAKCASVVLQRTPDHVQAIVEDDGRGFDTTAVLHKANGQDRLGLAGIKERLCMIGGVLNIESAPGYGCALVIRIPISKSA
jgi:signal transduction histidine kinase